FRRDAVMAQTPVMVITICTWGVRQRRESSTNRLFRPLLTPMCACFDSKTLQESIEDEKRASKNRIDNPDWQEGMAAFAEKRKTVFNRDKG
ncbi:MAG TPA: hypothetical protein DDZ38_00865, partial [Gammaproteobacteria bacterium]|nr:hypothetical protein [Gammaproteobacteria bacterium]